MERSLAMWELASRVQADPDVAAAAAARGGRLRQRWATRLPRQPGGAGAASQRLNLGRHAFLHPGMSTQSAVIAVQIETAYLSIQRLTPGIKR